MESCFLFFIQPCQLNVLNRPLTPFLAKGVPKMACCRKGETVRDFHGLVKYCTRVRIRVFYESYCH